MLKQLKLGQELGHATARMKINLGMSVCGYNKLLNLFPPTQLLIPPFHPKRQHFQQILAIQRQSASNSAAAQQPRQPRPPRPKKRQPRPKRGVPERKRRSTEKRPGKESKRKRRLSSRRPASTTWRWVGVYVFGCFWELVAVVMSLGGWFPFRFGFGFDGIIFSIPTSPLAPHVKCLPPMRRGGPA